MKEAVHTVDTVRERIARALAEGRPSLRAMARSVGLSVRTLQRLLAARGWTYAALLDDVRATVARQRVGQTGTSFKTVASDLGFAEPASFTRAFRHWTGLSPREYRRRLVRQRAPIREAGALRIAGAGPRRQNYRFAVGTAGRFHTHTQVPTDSESEESGVSFIP